MQSRRSDPIVEAFVRLTAHAETAPVILGRDGQATRCDIANLARAIQERLETLALTHEAPLGLLAPNGPGFLAALLACRMAENPVVLFDHRATPDEVRRITDVLKLAGLLRVTRSWPRDPSDVLVETIRDPRGERLAFPPRVGVVKLTSGSTGAPRGIALTSDSLLADDEALRTAMGIQSDDRLIAGIPFSHSYGLSSLVIPALAGGITLIDAEEDGPFRLLSAAASFGGTVLPTIPSWASAIARLAQPPPLPSSLRLVVTAGSLLHPEIAREFRERVGRRIHVFYGASECGGITYDPSGEAGERGTAGEAIRGVNVTLDPVEGFDPLQRGRVVVVSPAVALSYLPHPSPELENGRFVSHDLAERCGTEYRLVARLDHLIKIRGIGIDPSEVERVIARLDSVEEVVVHAVEHPGHRDATLRAVVACPEESLTAENITSWCRLHLSDDKVPRQVVLVRSIPRTTRGKIDHSVMMSLR